MLRFPAFSLALLIAAGPLAGCDGTDPADAEDLLVVEAFLYAGEPVDDVRITRVVPLANADDPAPTVDDATVRLVRGAETFALTASGARGEYAYLGDDLEVRTGDRFQLEVEQGGQRVTAETVVPPSPSGVALSDNVLEVPNFDGGFPSGPIGAVSLTLSWSNPVSDLHFVVVESLVQGEPEFILPDVIRDRFTGFSFTTEPTVEPVFDINGRQLEVLGRHRATVYRVNEEYGDLYLSREQDSRDLNEPRTNIVGGLGVFSAFHGAPDQEFRVVRE